MHLIACIVLLAMLTAVIMPIESPLAADVPGSNDSAPITFEVALPRVIEALEHFDPNSVQHILEAVLNTNQKFDNLTGLATLHYLSRSLATR
jgi:hypothetical protein